MYTVGHIHLCFLLSIPAKYPDIPFILLNVLLKLNLIKMQLFLTFSHPAYAPPPLKFMALFSLIIIVTHV